MSQNRQPNRVFASKLYFVMSGKTGSCDDDLSCKSIGDMESFLCCPEKFENFKIKKFVALKIGVLKQRL